MSACPSFTSSSDARPRRVNLPLTCVLALGLVLMAECALRVTGLQRRETRGTVEVLLDYQVEKMRRVEPGSIVLLGDSSLGTNVDARRLSQALGRPVVNLALVGDYTTVGDYHLLDGLIREGRAPRALVLVHTADMWGRVVASEIRADLDRRFEPWSLEAVSWRLSNVSALVRCNGLARRGLTRWFDGSIHSWRDWVDYQDEYDRSQARLAAFDYIEPPVRDWSQKKAKSVRWRFHVDPHVPAWLESTVALAHEHGIPVFFLTGPLWEKSVVASTAYLDALEADLTRRCAAMPGLALLRARPAPIPTHCMADSEDHIAPFARAAYTDWFGAQVQHALDPTSPAPPAAISWPAAPPAP